MTVAVGVAAPDGIILAADSRTTWAGEDRHRILSDTSLKVFGLSGRFGVASYGMAFVGEKTIAGLMDEFAAHVEAEARELDVHAFATLLGRFFDERMNVVIEEAGAERPEGWLLGFLVAGYDGEGIGHIVEVGVPGGDFGPDALNTAERGVMWRGQVDGINRLIKGVAYAELMATGVDVPQAILDEFEGLTYNLLLPITMQDAVNFALFLIRTTIDMQRFSDGTLNEPGLVPGCGGPVRLLAVTRSGVEWVSQPVLALPVRMGQAEGALS